MVAAALQSRTASNRRDGFYKSDDDDAPMSYFQSTEKRTAQLTCRVPKSVHDDVKELARFWSDLEKARTEDENAEVTISDVVVRLLQVGLDGAWGEFGERPRDAASYQKLLQVALKHLANSK